MIACNLSSIKAKKFSQKVPLLPRGSLNRVGNERRKRFEYSLCVGSAGSSCILTGEIFSDLGGP